MGKTSFLTAAVFALIFVLSSCGNPQSWKQKYSDLLQRAVALEHRHAQLQASIDSLWDVTSLKLDHSLPASLPPMDRAVFLNSRNADHIRMFMSFKQLDPDLQSLVNQAGEHDALLAKQMQELMNQQQVFEQQKIQFLREVEAKDKQAVQHYAAEFRKVSKD